MAEAVPKDPATLAALHPARSRELHDRVYKNSLHLYGSQFMTLKRPSRLPEAGREYAPGDPVNLIDWKAYGRLGQLIVREVRDEATSRVLIGIDASETMQWPSPDVPVGVAAGKAEVALRVGLHLAHTHLRMGDQVEVWLQTDGLARLPNLVLKPRRGAELIDLYERLVASGFQPEPVLPLFRREAFPRVKRDRAFWLGDGLGRAALGDILALGKRSLLLHVLSSLELAVDWLESGTSYFDKEGQLELKEYQGPVLKQPGSYQSQITAWCDALKLQQLQRGGDYLRLSETSEIASYLAALEYFIKAVGPGSETGAPR